MSGKACVTDGGGGAVGNSAMIYMLWWHKALQCRFDDVMDGSKVIGGRLSRIATEHHIYADKVIGSAWPTTRLCL